MSTCRDVVVLFGYVTVGPDRAGGCSDLAGAKGSLCDGTPQKQIPSRLRSKPRDEIIKPVSDLRFFDE